MIRIGVRNPCFGHLVKSEKTVEGKKDSETWGFLKYLDFPTEIIIHNEEKGDNYEEWLFLATGCRVYPDVRTYLEGETLVKALPGIKTYEEGQKIYEGFSTPEELAKYDFLAF